MKSGVIDDILSDVRMRQEKTLKKQDGSKTTRISGITKLDDANNAGTRNASKCTLILTEGDSAKSLAVSGLSVIGRDNFGVFPLRGKMLNVREATHAQISNNVEINFLKQILGLKHGTTYSNTDSLRYGHLMIMTDQVNDIVKDDIKFYRIMTEVISKDLLSIFWITFGLRCLRFQTSWLNLLLRLSR